MRGIVILFIASICTATPSLLLAQVADSLYLEEPIALFASARELSFAPGNRIFVLDERGPSLVELDAATGGVYERHGAPGRQTEPVAIDASDGVTVYLADGASGEVVRYSAGFRSLEHFPAAYGSVGSRQLSSVGVDRLGIVFAVSPRDGTLLRWAAPDHAPDVIGEMHEGPGELVEPVDLAISPEGHVYAADAGRGAVVKFDGWGSFVRVFETGISDELRRVHVYEQHVYVLAGQRLSRFDDGGNLIRQWQISGSDPLVDFTIEDGALFLLSAKTLFRLPVPE